MAMASFQRFSSQISRTPSLKSIIRSTTTTSSSTSSKKVSDRIVKLFAIDYKGQKREIIGLSGHTLLKALTNNGLIDPSSHRLEDIDACFFFLSHFIFRNQTHKPDFILTNRCLILTPSQNLNPHISINLTNQCLILTPSQNLNP
ncbi:hypothetical protein MKW94_023774, partial [Papaver nudicaule]|nr:hypothetical protein [Papaver nudicaule]